MSKVFYCSLGETLIVFALNLLSLMRIVGFFRTLKRSNTNNQFQLLGVTHKTHGSKLFLFTQKNISPTSVRILENVDKKNYEYKHLRSVTLQARHDLESTLGGKNLEVAISIALGNFHHEPRHPKSRVKV